MLSGIITGVLLVLFVGGWVWLWRPALREPLEAAGQLALDSELGKASGQRPDPHEARASAHSADPQPPSTERGP